MIITCVKSYIIINKCYIALTISDTHQMINAKSDIVSYLLIRHNFDLISI